MQVPVKVISLITFNVNLFLTHIVCCTPKVGEIADVFIWNATK